MTNEIEAEWTWFGDGEKCKRLGEQTEENNQSLKLHNNHQLTLYVQFYVNQTQVSIYYSQVLLYYWFFFLLVKKKQIFIIYKNKKLNGIQKAIYIVFFFTHPS